MRKVLTYGTFDLFHKGHYNILKRAKEQGDYLIVGVTGDTYDAERGKLSVQDSLATRIENVRSTGFADLIIVEEYLGQKIQDIIKYDVDVLVVGSDWKGKFDHLRKYCEVKYLERTKNISSTQIREEQKNLRLGIITEDLYDFCVVKESKYVSGINVECVYAKDAHLAEKFAETYELDDGYSDLEKFFDAVDVVYIKTLERAEYIRAALNHGKHVISDAPFSLSHQELEELTVLAAEKQRCLFKNIPMLYLHPFGQLIWNVRSNIIGQIMSIKASISKAKFDKQRQMKFVDLAKYPICAIMEFLGVEYEKVDYKLVRDYAGNVSYGMLTFYYENAVANAEIAFDDAIDFDGNIKIIGTDGIIEVPIEWWKIGYFKIKNNQEDSFKRYSFNLEGNGFRYVIQTLLMRIREEHNEFSRDVEAGEVETIEIFNLMQQEIDEK